MTPIKAFPPLQKRKAKKKKKPTALSQLYIYVFTALSLITGLWFVQHLIQENRRKKELRQREQERLLRLQQEKVLDSLTAVAAANKEYSFLQDFSFGYLNNYPLKQWSSRYQQLYESLVPINLDVLQLRPGDQQPVKVFLHSHGNWQQSRLARNEAYITAELRLHKTFFDSIEGKPLDDQQRRAVLVNEDNNIIVAGAGSGKTLTVAGKVSYLVRCRKVRPEEILILSYTKKSSEDLKNRLVKGLGFPVQVNTFHSLGLDIIGNAMDSRPMVIDQDTITEIIAKALDNLMQDSRVAPAIVDFLNTFQEDPKFEDEFDNHGDYIEFLKNSKLKPLSLPSLDKTGKLTLNKEKCKSMEEVQIANFLFVNGVEYIYEKPYEHHTSDKKHKQYCPDFYLPAYGIYLEHFGVVDEALNVPDWFNKSHYDDQPGYKEGIFWKREIHKKHQTKLVETYSYENRRGTLRQNLTQRLRALGVEFKPRSSEEIWQALQQDEKQVPDFVNLLATFLNLFKSTGGNMLDLQNQLTRLRQEELKKPARKQSLARVERAKAFVFVFEKVLEYYTDALSKRASIDFDDMINRATAFVRQGRAQINYRYVFVDEFQDISVSRYKLLKAIRDKNPASIFFVVGDDWQSIYRFAGSDISIFVDFEKYFGQTSKGYIEKTYRFQKQAIQRSSAFIMKNPNQLRKTLSANSDKVKEPYCLVSATEDENKAGSDILSALKSIAADAAGLGIQKPAVLFIGRYNYLVKRLKQNNALSVKWDTIKEEYTVSSRLYPTMSMRFLSAHRSKGLEADFVVLLECTAGVYGFPSQVADDPVLNLVLSEKDQFEFGEERRLFYVAMTRAKYKTYFLTTESQPSPFLSELFPEIRQTKSNPCPLCKKGTTISSQKIAKNGNPYTYVFCTNWNYGCKHNAFIFH